MKYDDVDEKNESLMTPLATESFLCDLGWGVKNYDVPG